MTRRAASTRRRYRHRVRTGSRSRRPASSTCPSSQPVRWSVGRSREIDASSDGCELDGLGLVTALAAGPAGRDASDPRLGPRPEHDLSSDPQIVCGMVVGGSVEDLHEIPRAAPRTPFQLATATQARYILILRDERRWLRAQPWIAVSTCAQNSASDSLTKGCLPASLTSRRLSSRNTSFPGSKSPFVSMRKVISRSPWLRSTALPPNVRIVNTWPTLMAVYR